MVMSTQTLTSASSLMSVALLVDSVDLYDVGEVETVGFTTQRPLTLVQAGVQALVQTTTLQNAVESQVANTYSIKVQQGTVIRAGQAVQVATCQQEPDLVGKKLLIDKVSQNGLALVRKAVASDFNVVDQQGKEGL